jgi:hypothetical protein
LDALVLTGCLKTTALAYAALKLGSNAQLHRVKAAFHLILPCLNCVATFFNNLLKATWMVPVDLMTVVKTLIYAEKLFQCQFISGIV